MAVGDFGSQIDSEVISLTNAPHNQPFANLFRVTSGTYALFFRRNTGLVFELASIAITDAGVITAAPISDGNALVANMGEGFQNFIQHPEHPNIFIGTQPTDHEVNTHRVTDAGVVTTFLDTFDIRPTQSGVVSLLHLTGDLFACMSETRLTTLRIDSAGTITAEVGPTSDSLPTSVRAFGRVHGNVAVYCTDSGANQWAIQTFTWNDDGTFDSTVLDTEIVSINDWTRGELLLLDGPLGILAASYHANVTGGVDDSDLHRVVVDSLGIVTTRATVYNRTSSDVNLTRPMLGDLGSRAFLELNEQSAGPVITSRVSDTLGVFSTVDTLTLSAGAKSPYFARVVFGTPGIFAVLTNTSNAGQGLTITTFEVEYTEGVAEPVAISGLVGMQQREILLL